MLNLYLNCCFLRTHWFYILKAGCHGISKRALPLNQVNIILKLSFLWSNLRAYYHGIFEHTRTISRQASFMPSIRSWGMWISCIYLTNFKFLVLYSRRRFWGTVLNISPRLKPAFFLELSVFYRRSSRYSIQLKSNLLLLRLLVLCRNTIIDTISGLSSSSRSFLKILHCISW